MRDVHKTIEAVWKIESTRLIAAIARVTRDIGVAEELAQDALVTALELWPEEGVPENPGAWLMKGRSGALSMLCGVVTCLSKGTKKLPGNWNGASSCSQTLWSAQWTKSSMMTSCGSSLPRTIRYFRWKRASRLRCV